MVAEEWLNQNITGRISKADKAKLFVKEAIKKTTIASHLIYITYPVIKEKRLFIKILKTIAESLQKGIESALLFENHISKMRITRNFDLDYEIFKKDKRLHTLYNLTNEEIKIIENIFLLVKMYSKSVSEFIRNDAFVMMNENLEYKKIVLDDLKKYLFKAQDILNKIKKRVFQF